MKKLYKSWGVHNLVGHPAMQICKWLGLIKLAVKIHDATLPPDQPSVEQEKAK